MLCYDRTEVLEGVDVNKRSKSKECIICHCWYFLGKGFKFQPTFCNGCHGGLMMSIDLKSIAILNIQGLGYHCIINGIRKSEAINLFKKADLNFKKWGNLKHLFFSYIKNE